MGEILLFFFFFFFSVLVNNNPFSYKKILAPFSSEPALNFNMGKSQKNSSVRRFMTWAICVHVHGRVIGARRVRIPGLGLAVSGSSVSVSVSGRHDIV